MALRQLRLTFNCGAGRGNVNSLRSVLPDQRLANCPVFVAHRPRCSGLAPALKRRLQAGPGPRI